ncbi:MAG: hypothetical protein EXR90_05265 [Methyloglobulus sp.]|nr:hypothetical protein [Methyloglobulus sp.]
MCIGILSLGVLVGFFIQLVNIGVYILAFFGLLRYACKCLYHSAQGNLSPPGVVSNMENSHESIPVKLRDLLIITHYLPFNNRMPHN